MILRMVLARSFIALRNVVQTIARNPSFRTRAQNFVQKSIRKNLESGCRLKPLVLEVFNSFHNTNPTVTELSENFVCDKKLLLSTKPSPILARVG